LFVIELEHYKDERGFFVECYNKKSFEENGLKYNFVQDNHSRSKYGVLRGLHFQRGKGQAKLLRCLKGSIFDVAVDLRRDSTTFGQWFGVELSEDNFKMLMIPGEFAHGFVTLSDEIDLLYKCDDFYNKEMESGIMWDDRDINIDWPIPDEDIIVSDRDKTNLAFRDFI